MKTLSLRRPRRTELVALMAISALFADVCQAQSCRQFADARKELNGQLRRIVQDNPGSTLVFGSCVVAGMSSYERTGDTGEATAAFTVCAGLGCALTDSYGNCIGVNLQLFALTLRNQDLQARLKRDCY